MSINYINYLIPVIYLPIWLQNLLQIKIYSNYYIKIYNFFKIFISLNNYFGTELVRSLQLNEFYSNNEKFKAKKAFLKVEEAGTHLCPFTLAYIERYLNNSKVLLRENKLLKLDNPNIKEILNSILIKKIFPNLAHPKTSEAQLLDHSLKLIIQLNQLKLNIINLQKLKYDSNDLNHEMKLLELWNNFNPGEELNNRISRQWVQLGFQGEDPATDFRGMGMLGLENLTYFSKNYSELSKKILKDSQDPEYWYPLAIVGINITSYCLDLLTESGILNHHLFNYGVNLEEFNEFYCYSIYQFNEFWLQSRLTPFLNNKPFTVMDFENALELFKTSEYYTILDFNPTNLNVIFNEKFKKIE